MVKLSNEELEMLVPASGETRYFTKQGGKVTLVTHPSVTHEIKSWAHFFQAIKEGRKLHDLRKNDRSYNVGDILLLREYDFVHGRYTGESLRAEITYITDNRTPCAFSSAVLPNDYCILSLKVIN